MKDLSRLGLKKGWATLFSRISRSRTDRETQVLDTIRPGGIVLSRRNLKLQGRRRLPRFVRAGHPAGCHPTGGRRADRFGNFGRFLPPGSRGRQHLRLLGQSSAELQAAGLNAPSAALTFPSILRGRTRGCSRRGSVQSAFIEEVTKRDSYAEALPRALAHSTGSPLCSSAHRKAEEALRWKPFPVSDLFNSLP
jgi:hypothetical protein